MKKIKNFLFAIMINPERKTNFVYYIDDYFLSTLIILNIICIILESYEPIYHHYYFYFHVFDVFSVIVFTLDYFIRIWISDLVYPELSKIKSRLKYMISPFGIVDLLSILPFYLPMFFKFDLRILRALRLLRLFRIFKLAHFIQSLSLIGKVIRSKKDELLITLFMASIIILLSSYIMFHIENQIQPDKFTSIFSALWWALATLTTIGYGDIYPVTALGQILAAFTALFGIGLVAIPTGIISMGFIEEISKRKQIEENQDEINYCPHCGKKLK
ncbi:MAG: potassium channel family protein [Actinobacteria bacterium]|nr:potassium channel family protein [Actinomycetota bacterium]